MLISRALNRPVSATPTRRTPTTPTDSATSAGRPRSSTIPRSPHGEPSRLEQCALLVNQSAVAEIELVTKHTATRATQPIPVAFACAEPRGQSCHEWTECRWCRCAHGRIAACNPIFNIIFPIDVRSPCASNTLDLPPISFLWGTQQCYVLFDVGSLIADAQIHTRDPAPTILPRSKR